MGQIHKKWELPSHLANENMPSRFLEAILLWCTEERVNQGIKGVEWEVQTWRDRVSPNSPNCLVLLTLFSYILAYDKK